MTNQHYTSAAGRAGNAALLISAMIFLFFTTSVALITWQFATATSVFTFVVFDGIGGVMMYFWWKTRPLEDDDESYGNVNERQSKEMSYELLGTRHSLSYLGSEVQRFHEIEKKASGNRAFGFVLVSMGIFVLGIAGIVGGFIFSWPLTLLGIASLTGGIVLRHG